MSTLAFYYPPRAHYFKKELVEFLLLSREQGIKPMTVLGSYAGAIGQPQFMPSSYRHFAINLTGSKKIDLRNNTNDVITSVANYFKQHGWENGQPIAAPVQLRKTLFTKSIPASNKPSLSLQILQNYGIRHHLNFSEDMPVGVIRLEDKYQEQYWIGFKNFYVIRRYNTSELYAMAVYQLAEGLKSAHTKDKLKT